MSTPLLVSLIVGGALLLLVIIIVVVAKSKKQTAHRVCGGCGRTMMPDWVKCMFCGWAPVPRLEFICGPLAGQVISLTEEVTTLGSVAGNTIVLSDPAVSRKHMGIRRGPEGFDFADLGSTNGVYVNGHRMPKKMLAPGDILRVGNSEMVFKQE